MTNPESPHGHVSKEFIKEVITVEFIKTSGGMSHWQAEEVQQAILKKLGVL